MKQNRFALLHATTILKFTGIGAMNMTLHGIENPKIEDRDSLSEDHVDKRDAYTLILANPPLKDHSITKVLQKICYK